MKIHFFVHGYAIPQGRPRFARTEKGVIAYDPATSKGWKASVRNQAIFNKADILFLGALDMRLSFYLLRPKSLPKKIEHHVKKPDLDNLMKAIKDALKGVCYRDDSQIISVTATKKYTSLNPGVAIEIMEV